MSLNKPKKKKNKLIYLIIYLPVVRVVMSVLLDGGLINCTVEVVVDTPLITFTSSFFPSFKRSFFSSLKTSFFARSFGELTSS